MDGQQMYFDPVRKKYVPATEREGVRQRVVQYLLEELDVPQRMIRIGEKLSHYGLPFRHRADVACRSRVQSFGKSAWRTGVE